MFSEKFHLRTKQDKNNVRDLSFYEHHVQNKR